MNGASLALSVACCGPNPPTLNEDGASVTWPATSSAWS